MGREKTTTNSDNNGINNLSVKDREEIRWIKVQRNIAILGVFAAIFTNSLQYITKAYGNYTEATLSINIEDKYLSSKSLVSIYSVNDNTKPIVKAHPNEVSNGLRLKDGSYLIKIELKETTLYEDYIHLSKAERKTFSLPSFFKGSFLVFAKTNAIKIYPDTPVPLIVESSKDGYLWIYELKKGENPEFKFPKQNKENAIKVGGDFILPRRNVEYIKSSKKIGKEKLLIIVTAKMEKSEADKLALMIANSSLQKADSSISKISYGFSTLSYEVQL